MKLLLTSKGITNSSIKNAFHKLLGKDFADLQIAYVTTGAYFVSSDKSWLVDEMMTFRTLNPGFFELIEFNSLPREEIIKRLDNSDVVVMSGGHAAAIMHAIDNKDLRGVLKQFAEEKLYCGLSAGSHIASKDLKLSTQSKIESYAEKTGYKAETGLGWVNFYTRAHYKEEKYPDLTEEYVKTVAQRLDSPIYAFDDQSAVVVNGDKIEIVSEGEYKIFVD